MNSTNDNYHCELPADTSMYDKLPYQLNPSICDGNHINLYTGNIFRGIPINYDNKKLIIPKENDEESEAN